MKIDRNNLFDLVYQVVRLIPRGRVSSYGAIAQCIGLKSGARMVGYAMRAAHEVPGVPAHRVVNSQGLLTGKHHFGSPTMQQLLEEEGVHVKKDKIVNFKKHFWDPSSELNPDL
ncbi:MAG TPA: MGMT family protein [Cyclobacteriaceae bacterium]|nr:MGMT family protein [Cyclobacteriaceae bacterium]